MKHTQVQITVKVFGGDGSHNAYAMYDEPQGEVSTVIFPCESYGDLLAQMVERATDEYVANLEGAEVNDDE